MTSVERMYALDQAIRYIERAEISGDIVECGVWRGGSSLLAALTLAAAGSFERMLHLFDTFEGMPPPNEQDVRAATGESAANILARHERQAAVDNVWAYATLHDVKQTMRLASYPNITYEAGPVEETLPAATPREIAILRLDTDWYGSTRHELLHLYPHLSDGGVLIVDDYGYWKGARTAVDEYFESRAEALLLNRIDDTGRIAVKRK